MTVRIYGTTKVGKSTIARLIEKTLIENGIKAEMKEDSDYASNDEKRSIIDASMKERIDAIKVEVEIEEYRPVSNTGMSA